MNHQRLQILCDWVKFSGYAKVLTASPPPQKVGQNVPFRTLKSLMPSQMKILWLNIVVHYTTPVRRRQGQGKMTSFCCEKKFPKSSLFFEVKWVFFSFWHAKNSDPWHAQTMFFFHKAFRKRLPLNFLGMRLLQQIFEQIFSTWKSINIWVRRRRLQDNDLAVLTVCDSA